MPISSNSTYPESERLLETDAARSKKTCVNDANERAARMLHLSGLNAAY